MRRENNSQQALAPGLPDPFTITTGKPEFKSRRTESAEFPRFAWFYGLRHKSRNGCRRKKRNQGHFPDVRQNSIFLFNPYSRANRYYLRVNALGVGPSNPGVNLQFLEHGLMSVFRQVAVAVALALGISAPVVGQNYLPGPSFSPAGPESVGNTRPLAEPGIFDWDGQMFAPVDFDSEEERAANTGFFFTVDRVYNSVSRGGPRDILPAGITASSTPTGSDWGWGNRYEGGWMTEADSGWMASYEYSTGSFFAAGSDERVANPMLVTSRFSNFELNRVFRQEVSSGGIFEPYAGFRYLGLSDKTIEDTTPTIGGVLTGNRFKQSATNSAFGAHVGGRYSINRGRFRYALDGALATTYNRQRYHAMDLQFQGTAVQTSDFNDSDEAFVPILDTRLEVAYSITRDIGLRGGFQLLYLWDGMARSDNTSTFDNPNSIIGAGGGRVGIFDENATIAGFSFGLEWKR